MTHIYPIHDRLRPYCCRLPDRVFSYVVLLITNQSFWIIVSPLWSSLLLCTTPNR